MATPLPSYAQDEFVSVPVLNELDQKVDPLESSSKDTELLPQLESSQPPAEHEARPQLDYSSTGAFFSSLYVRLKSIFTYRFVLSLVAGQIISWCITSTNLLTTELVNRGFDLPTTQTFFLYFALFVIYTPFTMYKYGLKGWFTLLYKDGWKYALLGACDMEGNFLVVKAYQWTNLLSCELLDAWAIPVCMFFTFILIGTRFKWAQIAGIAICVAGLGLLVASDQITHKDYSAANMPLGDGYMILGATLYGFTNALEEFLVRRRPFYEVVGQLGMWGMIWNAIQCTIIERKAWYHTNWDGAVIGFLFLYTFSLFILYTLAPLLYRSSSSVYYNLSILTSDFYGLLIGLSIYSFHPYWLYFVAFAVVIVGLIIYFWTATPEEQGNLNVTRPDYVNQVSSTEEARIAGFAPNGDLRNDHQV